MYKRFLKRFVDFLIVTIGLVILILPMLAISLLMVMIDHHKPFYTQKRPGKHGKLFTLLKFKTMNDKTDSAGNLLPDVERLTSFGKTIRKLSLDELPQMINIMKGDMSIVGPRPLLTKYLPLYNAEQSRRHEVKPGITGWAQINGRNAISWEEKFKLDVYYVDHISFGFDLKIIILTVWKVFKREGINSNRNETMPMFTGSKN